MGSFLNKNDGKNKKKKKNEQIGKKERKNKKENLKDKGFLRRFYCVKTPLLRTTRPG